MDRNKKLLLLKQLEDEKLRRANERILTEYYPRSFHWQFLTAWITQGSKKNLFVGSNQSGKTTVGCILARGICIGYHSWIKNYAKYVKKEWKSLKFPKSGWWFKDEFKTAKEAHDHIMTFESTGIRIPAQIAICVKDFKVGVGKVFEPKLTELIPGPYKDGPYVKNIERMQGKVAEKIIFQNGSTIHFFSGEQDTFRFEGGTWDAIFWDEPPKQSHYVAMDRGTLVKDAPMFFHLTPLSEPWMFDTLLEDAKKGDERVHYSTCDLFSEEVDWMTDEKKEQFKREVEREDPHQVEARVHGKFTHLLGRIFPTYDEGVHLLDSNEIEQLMTQDVTYGVTVDPHDRRPCAIAFWFVNPTGDLYFFKNYPIDPMPEIKQCDLTIENYAEMLKDVEKNLPGGKITHWFIDPNKAKTPRKTDRHAGQTLLDDFALYQLYFDAEINDKIDEGHREVRNYLYYDTEKEVDFKNRPKMYVSKDCWNINTAMMRYTWDDKKSKEVAAEKVHEKWKDFADCVRYTCIKKPIWLARSETMVYNPPIKGRIYGK